MSRSQRKLSPQTMQVLSALADAGADWRYGLELSRTTGLKSGSLYPILVRLAERGLVEDQWLEPEVQGRPLRHAYRLTGPGRRALIEASQAAAPDHPDPQIAGAIA